MLMLDSAVIELRTRMSIYNLLNASLSLEINTGPKRRWNLQSWAACHVRLKRFCCCQLLFKCCFTERQLQAQRKKLKIPWDSFLSQTKQAFEFEKTLPDSFLLEFKLKGSAAELFWKRHLVSEDIKFQVGSVSLSKDINASSGIIDILSKCIDINRKSRRTKQNLEQEKKDLTMEREILSTRLDKIASWKEGLESDLYGKFVLAINEKKKKILELERELDEYASGRRSSVLDRTAGRKRKSSEVVSGESDSDDLSPSVGALSKDDSLLLGDDSVGISAATTTRRDRGRQSKKQTPAKPKLPRVSTGASSGSSRGAELLNTDDLLDEF